MSGCDVNVDAAKITPAFGSCPGLECDCEFASISVAIRAQLWAALRDVCGRESW